MRKRVFITHFRLLLLLLFILIVIILSAIWHSQQKVNVIDRELQQKQIN